MSFLGHTQTHALQMLNEGHSSYLPVEGEWMTGVQRLPRVWSGAFAWTSGVGESTVECERIANGYQRFCRGVDGCDSNARRLTQRWGARG